jgi:hypothetical protein
MLRNSAPRLRAVGAHVLAYVLAYVLAQSKVHVRW